MHVHGSLKDKDPIIGDICKKNIIFFTQWSIFGMYAHFPVVIWSILGVKLNLRYRLLAFTSNLVVITKDRVRIEGNSNPVNISTP